MKPYSRFQFDAKPARSPLASFNGLAQRKCACGGTCATCSDSVHANDSIRQPRRVNGLGHNFGTVGVFAADRGALAVQDQTPTQSGGLDEGLIKEVPPASTMEPTTELDPGTKTSSGTPVIDSVEMVSSASGAIGGFEEITCDASLNQPGPYNDIWAKGSIANVHQVHFHVSQGWAGDVRAKRVVNRMSAGQGQQFPKTGDDGPPPHEFQFTKDKMVIADAPGWCRTLKESDFPVTYTGDFGLYAYDPLNMNILASISYHVEISKTYFGQIDPVNTVTVTDTKIGRTPVKSPAPPKK
jgi:hypothetical protein